MSEDRRKTNKQCTGTVPKIKYRNNTSSYTVNDQEGSRHNNLSSFWHHPDSTNFIRNPKRNSRNNYFTMDVTLDQQNLQPLQNGVSNCTNSNSVSTPNTSSSASRRNSASSTLKCDNVTKYPDKKQIEDKLSQIREYLQITSSLMTSMKNTEDQINDQAEKNSLIKMMSDLKDSEKKLVSILEELNDDEDNKTNPIEVKTESQSQVMENGIDNVSENSASSSRRNDIEINNLDNHDIDALREQQFALLKLQQKAENRLKDVRQAQDKLLIAQFGNQVNVANQKDNKNMSISEFDTAIQELEERAKRLNQPRQSNPQFQDKIMSEVESLHNKILTMHHANNEREQLIEVLDNRDAELRSQQAELQNKLVELQNKKQQIDHLVVQLQTIDDDEGDDVGGQVRKIVTMKDQLKKLKDMLEIVKTTEKVMSNTNVSAEAQAAACEICTTAENFLQNEIQKPRSQSNESNVVLRYDNNTSGDNRQKQVNKNPRDQNRAVKQRTSSINEKLALQAELEAKKKELEDIMGKHKAGTSNLNHDVGVDNKSEFSCTSNSVNERSYWRPLVPLQNQDDASERFSSDECEEDEYSELHDNQNMIPTPTLNYSPSNAPKRRPENNSEYVFPTERLRGLSHTPERNVRSSSVATSGYIREQPRSNSEHDKLQKQLQLIKNVCDSMLEQQNPNTQPSNVQQLRNNLTPSPYSEPRRFASPNPHSMNALNVLNTNADVPWFPGVGPNANANTEMNNYHNWLTTNTLQTQSFMMNTLNQCCQMLWLQQRELVSLRNTVSMLQERIDNQCVSQGTVSTPLQQPTPLDQQRTSNQYRPNPTQKVNQVSSACSMPNLNHYNAPPSNLDLTYANHSNLQNSRLLDPCLNNINHHLNVPQGVVENPNNVLHGVNANINQTMPAHMWNGQALNNQVAPGNRANNYWDNFRSYSRQNLLSTKNIEVLHNPPSTIDRSNVGHERTNPFSLMSFSKSNSEQDSASTSHENTPQRRLPYKTSRHVDNSNNSAIPPPDVLNVNHNIAKPNDSSELSSGDAQQDSNDDLNVGFHMLLNLNSYNEAVSAPSNTCEEHNNKESHPRRRNEWNNEVQEERPQKSKLFDELRDNVYKEVASLISANEARPHFLIQLFRDLQMIGSDSLRLKILQSIQSVITHSLISSQNSNRQSIDSQQSRDADTLLLQDNFSLQSTVWSKPTKNYLTGPRNMVSLESEGPDLQSTFKEIIPFLNDHEHEIINNHFLLSLKQLFLESDSFKETVKDTIFQKHFSNVLDEVLEQYCGKKVRDVKMHFIQTVSDLLRGELSFIQLIQETNPENCPILTNNEVGHSNVTFSATVVFDGQNQSPAVTQPVDNNIQNGDLAEADQSRVVDDDIEEEGAVGGVLEVPQETDSRNLSHGNSEEVINLTAVEFPCNTEGLDQVPIRLPTKTKSRSTTPNRDRSNSHSEQDLF